MPLIERSWQWLVGRWSARPIWLNLLILVFVASWAWVFVLGVGLIYEAFVRLDRGRLSTNARWVGATLVFALVVLVIGSIGNATTPTASGSGSPSPSAAALARATHSSATNTPAPTATITTPTPTLPATPTARLTSPATPTARPTPVATPAPTPKPTPAITPAPQSWAFSGSADKKTKPFSVSGTLKVTYSISSDFNFIVDLNGTDGTPVATIANVIGSFRTTTWVYGVSGDVYLDVLANGPWSITVSQVEPTTVAVPAKFSGTWGVTTVPVKFSGGETATWSAKGDGNFIVDLIDPTDGSPVDNVVNTIGAGADSTQIYSSGPYALEVTANGPWTISITP